MAVLEGNAMYANSTIPMEQAEGGSFSGADGIPLRRGQEMELNSPSPQGEGTRGHGQNAPEIRGGKKQWRK